MYMLDDPKKKKKAEFSLATVLANEVTKKQLLGFIEEIVLCESKIKSEKEAIKDIRGEAQRSFFHNMDFYSFFFGYKKNFVFAYGTNGNITNTFNVFLDMWNRYGFFQVFLFGVVILIRIYKQSKFHFPVYFLIPFLIYSMVESIFFPNFWDCIIYILFFTPKKNLPFFNNFFQHQVVLFLYVNLMEISLYSSL